jgi:hypothetical protein
MSWWKISKFEILNSKSETLRFNSGQANDNYRNSNVQKEITRLRRAKFLDSRFLRQAQDRFAGMTNQESPVIPDNGLDFS